MELQRDLAVFVRSSSEGEAGYVLLTKRNGKIFAFRRRSIPGILVPLNLLRVHLRQHPRKPDAFILLQATPEEVFLKLRRSNRKVIVGLTFLDIVDKLLPWNEPAEHVFTTLVKLLKYLEEKDIDNTLFGLLFAFLLYTMKMQGISLMDDRFLAELSEENRHYLKEIAVNPLNKLRELSRDDPERVVNLLQAVTSYLEGTHGIQLKSMKVIAELSRALKR